MSVYKRNCVYHYDFWLSGKRYRGTTGQKTETKARKVEQILMGEARNGRMLDRKAPSLAKLGERFVQFLDASNGLDADTVRYYKNGWRMLKATQLAGMCISDITSEPVDKFGPSEGSGYNINNARRTLRRMLSKAVEWKLIPNAPEIVLVEEHAREAVFTPQQDEAALKIAPQPLRDVLMLIRDSGMRPEEIERMQIEYIDWTERKYFVANGKTKAARRFVPLSDRCVEALRARCGHRKEGWVFPSERSKSGHISPLPCNRQFSKMREALRLGKEYVLYTARHSFGTEVMRETGNPKLVMRVMGHSDLKTTMRYVHPELNQVRDVINQRNNVAVQ